MARPGSASARGVAPFKPGFAEGVVLVDQFAGDEVADDVGGAAAGGLPVFGLEGFEVDEERVFLVASEGLVEQVEGVVYGGAGH